jgi:hypothetical protein
LFFSLQKRAEARAIVEMKKVADRTIKAMISHLLMSNSLFFSSFASKSDLTSACSNSEQWIRSFRIVSNFCSSFFTSLRTEKTIEMPNFVWNTFSVLY